MYLRYTVCFSKQDGDKRGIFEIVVVIQSVHDVNYSVFACFIYCEKALDKVQHQELIEALRASNIDDKDIPLIVSLYKIQKANILVEEKLSSEFSVKRGDRQGCILSLLLFNEYSENLVQEDLQEVIDGKHVDSDIVNNIRYAHDTVLLADSTRAAKTHKSQILVSCLIYRWQQNVTRSGQSHLPQLQSQ